MNKTILLWILIANNAFYGCASLSNRSKAILLSTSSALAAGTIGYITTPKDGTSKFGHGLFFASVAGFGVLLGGMYLFDEQKVSSQLKEHNLQLQYAFDKISTPTQEHEKILIENVTSRSFSKEIPLEYRHLVRPGEWSVYKLDQWIQAGEGVIVHQDKMLQLKPPQLIYE